ncbi:MAG TPA: FecR domain-containing protein [Steroidobacteraceae bacterium]|nr:FecR domain-containing protein [Steroidobacteraceae bacterium]
MTTASEISNTAAAWLVRMEAETSAAVWDAFEAWLEADVRHRAAFIRLRTAWTHLDRLKNLRPLDGIIDSDLLAPGRLPPSAVAELGWHPLEGRPRSARAWLRRPAQRRWLAAAAVTAAIGLAIWLGGPRMGWNRYTTAVGAQQKVALQDGSTVELNTNTELRTRLSGSRRDIRLTRGEALFRVAHDEKRPFYVIAADAVVRDVGTAFSVRIRGPHNIEVIVAQGRVAVGAQTGQPDPEHPTVPAVAPSVSAGEAATVQSNTVSVQRLQSDDLTRKLAWTDGRLAFHGETLREAVQEFNRYNQRRLLIADPSIDRMRVGGIFQATDPDSFVAALERSFGVRAVPTRGSAEIRLLAGDKPSG